MNKSVIIIGEGGHGHVIADIVAACGDRLLGYLDDCPAKNALGPVSRYRDFPGAEFVIGIGNADIRKKISLLPVKWYSAIHPTAVVSPSAFIGEGTVVMPNAVINAGAKVGNHCIVNTAAVVEHNNVIEDYAHISVGAKLGGDVHIGCGTWIGIGAAVKNGVTVTSGCMIGAGAVVVRDLTESGTYVGVPAKKQEGK